MKIAALALVMFFCIVMNVYAQGAVAEPATEKPVVAEPATQKPAVAEPATQNPVVSDAKTGLPLVNGNQRFLVISEGGGGLNSFVIVDIEKKISYTCNVYGNGGVKWEAQDLEELSGTIEQARVKKLGKKK